MNPYFLGIVVVVIMLSLFVARTSRSRREAFLYGTGCGVLLGGVAGFLVGMVTAEEALPGQGVPGSAIDLTWKAALFGGVASLLTAALGWSGNRTASSPTAKDGLRRVPASRSRVLRRLKDHIKQDRIINPQLFAYLDFDQVVARRDQVDYQREWLRAMAEIADYKAQTALDEHDIDLVNRIRGSVYKKTLAITDHLPLSDRIAEELGLVALAVLIDYRDGWVSALGQAYFEGRLPEHPLTPVGGDLAELVPEAPSVPSTTPETA
ncbi:MAG: hypothetical protein AB7K24_34295 [Gemmataceae bacterium]